MAYHRTECLDKDILYLADVYGDLLFLFPKINQMQLNLKGSSYSRNPLVSVALVTGYKWTLEESSFGIHSKLL